MDLTGVTWRRYSGTEAQSPDPFMATKMGATSTPTYRGLAYVVFENLALTAFGNRLPRLTLYPFLMMDVPSDNVLPNPQFRQCHRCRVGRRALAGPEHLLASSKFRGVGRQDRPCRRAGFGLLWHHHARQLRGFWHHGDMDRRRGLGHSPDDPALRPPLCRSGRD